MIGLRGRTKRELEKKGKVKLAVSAEGDVRITGESYEVWRAHEVVKAIARGFAPEKAFKLFNEDYYFRLIDLGDMFSSEKDIHRYKGRIIGENGKSRRIIEETSEVFVCVYGDTVGLIGPLDSVNLATEAIEALLQGASHARVYSLLERGRRKLKEENMKLWK